MNPRHLLPLLALLLGAADTPPATLADLRPLPLQSGVNHIDHLAPDGRAGQIILAWRDNGNAWGYDLYTVLLPGPNGTWQVAGIERPSQDPYFNDTIRDSPHTGEDVIRAVRFARGTVAGRPAILLLEASRAWKDTPYNPAPTTYDAYVLQENEDGVGRTPYYFRQILHRPLPTQYCHAEKALAAASGLPLRPGYEGKDTPNGC